MWETSLDHISNLSQAIHYFSSFLFFIHSSASSNLMAEAVILGFAQNITGSLVPILVNELGQLWGIKDELERLKNTASLIKYMLPDEEEKYDEVPEVKAWLLRLKDVFIDTEDLLDEISTAALGNEVRSNWASKFISSSKNTAFILSVASRIKANRRKIDVLENNSKLLLEKRPSVESRAVKRREPTHSFVPEEEILGRDHDKTEIIQLLLETGGEEYVSVIPIVGLGGLGKTALAQSVFNHQRIEKHFQKRIWVHVSDAFDMKSIMRQIIGSERNMEMDQLQDTLRKKIDGKRYLLVLDDYWKPDNETWSKLKNLLMGGARGSKILITTRLNSVAETTGTTPQPYNLGCLSEEMSRSLFVKIAFGKEEDMMLYADLIPIGESIINKCRGVPLAIRSLGSLLRTNRKREFWSRVREQRLSQINMRQEEDVLRILKLSYDHLPSHLKQCFAYCSLFPKGYRVRKDDLIQLWMAHGFIQSEEDTNGLDLEDAGEESFMELVTRNFFHDLQKDDLGDVESCKMHDLMHEVAVKVAGHECTSFVHNTAEIRTRILHVSYESIADLPRLRSEMGMKLRTMLCLAPRCPHVPKEPVTLPKDLWRHRCLRVLDLHNANIKTVPRSIKKLIHLRELDLSYNPIEELPASLVKLYNLQTLKLQHCEELKVLPRDIRKLAKLRHVDIIGCQKLSHMPQGLGELTSLHTLSKFVLPKVGSTLRGHACLNELRKLDSLSGKFEIENLGWTKEAVLGTKGANLSKKGRLQKLNLRWYKGWSNRFTERFANHEAILEGLQPNQNLRCLLVEHYEGMRFPRWMVEGMMLSIPNLVEIRLRYCPNIRHLPPLDQLPYLKTLELSKLDTVESIGYSSSGRGVRELDDPAWTGSGRIQLPFPRLSKLSVNSCPKLESLPTFPQLEQLSLSNINEGILRMTGNQLQSPLKKLFIWDMPTLEKVPKEWLQRFTSLESMSLGNCLKLTSLSLGMQKLTKLTRLDIQECKDLHLSVDEDGNALQLQGLTNLHDVRIIQIPKLVSLPEWLLHLPNLQHLYLINLSNLASLPWWIGNLRSLRSLSISECPSLKGLPEEISNLTCNKCGRKPDWMHTRLLIHRASISFDCTCMSPS